HSKQRVGGTKNISVEKIREIKPDLIIGNKEENTETDIQQLKEIAPVWMSDIDTLQHSVDMILEIGKITNREKESQQLTKAIQQNFFKLSQKISKKWTCLYFMWKEPYFTVGKNTFIDAMIESCGGINLQTEARYPE